MIDDGLNGRLPFAAEATPGGHNKPGETFEQFEVRMAYHEAVLAPHYPMPVRLYDTPDAALIINLFKAMMWSLFDD